MLKGGQVMLRSAQQLGLFARIDAGSGAAKCGAAAQANLNENMDIAVLQDKINLAKTATVVHLQQLQTLSLQILRGQLFSQRACIAHFAGIGGAFSIAAALRAALSAAFAAAFAASIAATPSGVRP